MPTQYHLRLRKNDNTMIGIYGGLLSFEATSKENNMGAAVFEVFADHPITSTAEFKLGAHLELWRYDSRYPFPNRLDDINHRYKQTYLRWAGVIRGTQIITREDGRKRLRILCLDGWFYLDRSINAFPAGLIDATEFRNKSAEFIIRSVVDNGGGASSVLRTERKRRFQEWNMDTQPSAVTSSIMDASFAWRNVLQTVRELAEADGLVIRMRRAFGGLVRTWDVEVLRGYSREDRRNLTIFGVPFRNVLSAETIDDHRGEVNAAIVMGAGAGVGREGVVVTGNSYALGSNEVETYVDARDVAAGDLATLNTRGAAVLSRSPAIRDILVEVQETTDCLAGEHFDMGFLVTTYHQGVREHKHITGLTERLSEDGRNSIDLEMRDYTAA